VKVALHFPLKAALAVVGLIGLHLNAAAAGLDIKAAITTDDVIPILRAFFSSM
jgi:hypothetical protein